MDRRVEVLVNRDFATTCTCTCQHYCAIFMHSACVHVRMYMHVLARIPRGLVNNVNTDGYPFMLKE